MSDEIVPNSQFDKQFQQLLADFQTAKEYSAQAREVAELSPGDFSDNTLEAQEAMAHISAAIAGSSELTEALARYINPGVTK